MTSIAIIQGHPDNTKTHLCHALADAYAEGALAGGHTVARIEVAELDFPLLRSQEDWQAGKEATPSGLRDAQEACMSADHLVLLYPLWLGTLPALLKGFLEQAFRPGVALSYGEGFPKGLMKGKSARVIVTMGMPALAYRFYFGAHSLKSLQRNILGFVGISPIRNTVLGMVENVGEKRRKIWREKMRKFGEQAH
ncbi:MAG: NAD(P)H-dependent oxidoreductase [Pseudomonadota bacterium]